MCTNIYTVSDSLHKSCGDDNDALTISFFGCNYHTTLIISIYSVHHYQLSASVISASIMELIFIDGQCNINGT